MFNIKVVASVIGSEEPKQTNKQPLPPKKNFGKRLQKEKPQVSGCLAYLVFKKLS